MGNRRLLADNIIRQFTGYMPLFRGLIQLLNENPPINHGDVVAVLSRLTGTETDIFEDAYAMKKKQFKPTFEQPGRGGGTIFRLRWGWFIRCLPLVHQKQKRPVRLDWTAKIHSFPKSHSLTSHFSQISSNEGKVGGRFFLPAKGRLSGLKSL